MSDTLVEEEIHALLDLMQWDESSTTKTEIYEWTFEDQHALVSGYTLGSARKVLRTMGKEVYG